MSQENKIVLTVVAITIFLLLVVFFIIVMVAYIHRRKKSLQAVYENELLKTQLEIQEHTFEEISQEIHDNIGQALSFIKLNISTVNLNEPKHAKASLVESKQLITKVIQDLRDLSKTLNTDFITRIGLPQALEQQLNMLNKSNLYETHLVVNGNLRNCGNKEELVIYRIIQELLNNTVKHAVANKIDIEMNYLHDELSIKVSDNGKGFDLSNLPNNKGLGIENMKKRMGLINGTFEISSRAGEGTVAYICLKKI
jgi:signal transduction histidine kinase